MFLQPDKAALITMTCAYLHNFYEKAKLHQTTHHLTVLIPKNKVKLRLVLGDKIVKASLLFTL
jgi:hypothetical protein